jgi:mono/diheme cytochrome c family protein
MRLLKSIVAFAAAALLAAIRLSGATPEEAATPEFFETRVRPVLAASCYSCHGDAPLGGLRLDRAADFAKGGSRGPVVVPGDPEKSLLIQVVKHTDPRLKMPLGGKKLTDAQIEDLSAWVAAGAKWPKETATVETSTASDKYVIPAERKKFWSFLPLAKPTPPAVKNTAWPKTAIDRFVLAKLEQEGMKPVAPASKRDLLRRAYLDLIGLPPTYEEIEAFEKDKSPDAFAKVVDKLLASPKYGERWGRIWLDVARYGEDDYRSLNPNPRGYYPYPNAYLYRDWVIQAFNDDMPYDTFVKAQIAGDLMDESVRHKMLPATGFLGLGPWYFDNGAAAVTRADERHDRVDVVTRGFMGLTVACARCHNHKYDPIPQTDYYALAGVFLNTDYHEYPRVPSATLEKYLAIKDQVEKKQQRLQEMQTELSNQLSQSLVFKTAEYLQAVWEVTGPQKRDKAAVVEARKLDYELLDRWIRYMEKTTDRYPQKNAWQAMMKKSNSTAQEAKRLAEEFQAEAVRVMIARRDLDQENEIIYAQALEGTKKKKRASKPNEFKTDDDFCPGCALRLKNLPEEDNNFWTELFQRELRDNDDPNDMNNMGRQGNPGVLLFRGWGLESRVGADAKLRLETLRADIEKQQKELEPAYSYIHGVRDVDNPRDLELAIRGNPENLGEKVPRHFLSVFSDGDPEPFKHGSGRMELAERILEQPITMRVIVNRIWKGHFGTGIVDTPSNFGMGGERPTNPELLEYLASFFKENGMSIKKLHREIMLSSVYQLSTANDPVNFAKDSGNRLYWRADRRRMDAEQLRDSVLYVSGNLDDLMGGPSQELTPANTRRTVYGKVSRYKLDTYLQLFDFPSPSISAEKRFTTTVPLQRLFLMNSDFMQIQAEELAKRVASEPNNEARIRKAHLLVYGRQPTAQEIALGLEYLSSEPMRQYEELKAKEQEEKAKSPSRGRSGQGAPATKVEMSMTEAPASGMPPEAGALEGKPMDPMDPVKPMEVAAKPAEASEGGEAAAAAPPEMEMGMGMMGGVMGRRGGAGGAPEVKYTPTAWGRYAKILLSSSEFLFIN